MTNDVYKIYISSADAVQSSTTYNDFYVDLPQQFSTLSKQAWVGVKEI